MRLIDADDLEKFMKEHICAVSTDGEGELLYLKNGYWVSAMSEIPTAFDKEKVLEQLSDEEMYFETSKMNNAVTRGKAVSYRNAIEIVEDGGV